MMNSNLGPDAQEADMRTSLVLGEPRVHVADQRPEHACGAGWGRQSPDHIPHGRRGVAQLPADLVGDCGWIMRGGQPCGLRSVGNAACMGRHVGHGRRVTCCAGCGYCGRVDHLPSRRVCPGGKGADHSDPHLATREGSDAVDGFARPGVARCLYLEQEQRPLSAVGGPHGQHSSIILAQCQGPGLVFHGEGSPFWQLELLRTGDHLPYPQGRNGMRLLWCQRNLRTIAKG